MRVTSSRRTTAVCQHGNSSELPVSQDSDSSRVATPYKLSYYYYYYLLSEISDAEIYLLTHLA